MQIMPKAINIKVALLMLLLSCGSLAAQSYTFSVDRVVPASKSIGWEQKGNEIAVDLHRDYSFDTDGIIEPVILANSFANDSSLYWVGEDVMFQMLLKSWCKHYPVVLTPDAVWMVIAQGLSYYINENSEKMRYSLVDHDGKQKLSIETEYDLFSGQADWDSIIAGFTAGIDKYTNNDLAATLVADFSTTGINERIASEITLMDVVKPYFEYEVWFLMCGIPSVTLTGTPDDWQKVLDKTQVLRRFNLGWWADELEPILKQFISAAQGDPDISFWKNMVKTSRPLSIQGPSCARRSPIMTRFDGWFLKLFPFDGKGRTPSKVTLSSTVLRETVCVPFQYKIVDNYHNTMQSFNLELVAGVVCVQEDPQTFALTPKIGWFVRTAE